MFTFLNHQMPKSSAPLVNVMKNQVSYWTCTFQTCLRGQLLEPYMEQLIVRTSGFLNQHIQRMPRLSFILKRYALLDLLIYYV
jgi:hypothetical protein